MKDNKSSFLNYLCLILLLVLASAAYGANSPLDASGNQTVDWLKTDADNLDLEAVRQLPEARWSRVAPNKTLNVGFDDAEIWVRMAIPPSQSERYLEVGYPLLDHVRVDWVSAGERLSGYQTGDQLKFDTRPVRHRHFLFPVPITPEPVMAYIRI